MLYLQNFLNLIITYQNIKINIEIWLRNNLTLTILSNVNVKRKRIFFIKIYKFYIKISKYSILKELKTCKTIWNKDINIKKSTD